MTKRTLLTISIIALFLSATYMLEAQTYRDARGNRLGQIKSDGTVRNSSGNRLGIVEKDGTVRDVQGNRIGKAEGNDKRIIGAAYFFFFFK